MLDEPEFVTPKKARYPLDAKNRLQDEHVPVLAMLFDALLDDIAKLDMKLDLSTFELRRSALVRQKQK